MCVCMCVRERVCVCVPACVCVCILHVTSLSLAGNLGCTAATRAALPIPIHVCSIFVCPNNGIWLPVLGMFNVHTNVDVCDCTTCVMWSMWEETDFTQCK